MSKILSKIFGNAGGAVAEITGHHEQCGGTTEGVGDGGVEP